MTLICDHPDGFKMSDQQDIRTYLDERDSDAFARILHRHMRTVYQIARRHVRDPHLAEDVAQNVFVTLARRAPSIPQTHTLAGWLINTARFESLNAMRSESRRRRHEAEAARLAAARRRFLADREEDGPRASCSALLDRLSEADRQVVILHYLEQKTAGEVGTELGISEPAAARRATRAVQKLRDGLRIEDAA